MSPPSFCPLFPGSRMNPSMGLGGDIPVANAPMEQAGNEGFQASTRARCPRSNVPCAQRSGNRCENSRERGDRTKASVSVFI